jgi:CDP-glucose 4,6-dehydratase
MSAALAPSAFAGRRVLVTGHTGFKGSWLCLALSRLGARTSGFALPPPTTPSHFELAGIAELLQGHVIGDVRDPSAVAGAIDTADPEVIFHLAAQPLVRASYEAPVDTFATNVMGTVNVLEAVRVRARPCRPCVIVVVTSDKAYENVGQPWGYRECDALGGHDPYSASKGAAELVVASYRRSFFAPERVAAHGVKVATARAGNVIGGGDFARDRIVVDAARALAEGLAVPVRNPDAIRPWQHVLEPLHGYLHLAARMLASDEPRWCSAWNFGPLPGDELPVSALVERLCAAWGDGRWIDAREPGAVHEASVLRLAIDKTIAELGVRPRWRVEEAIARTARWYRQWAGGAAAPSGSMREASLADLRAYEPLDA